MSKGNGNTTTLLFSLKRLQILHQERRGQVKTIVSENFNSILSHESGFVNMEQTYQPINQYVLGQRIKKYIILNVISGKRKFSTLYPYIFVFRENHYKFSNLFIFFFPSEYMVDS